MKTLLFDIEVMAMEAYTWGMFETNVVSVKEHWYMISFAYKWLGDKRVQAYSLPDFKGYKHDKKNDRALCHKLWELFDEADCIVAHNGFAYDSKKSTSKFVQHGFPPPTPYQQIDTKRIAKKYFKFDSNRLDYLADYLGVGRKMKTGGWDLWLDCCVKDDPKAWDKMVKYNKHDVTLLEAVYKKFLPYITTHPNHNMFDGTTDKCPNCGGGLNRRGFSVTRVSRYQKMQCKNCGAWSQKPLRGVVR